MSRIPAKHCTWDMVLLAGRPVLASIILLCLAAFCVKQIGPYIREDENRAPISNSVQHEFGGIPRCTEGTVTSWRKIGKNYCKDWKVGKDKSINLWTDHCIARMYKHKLIRMWIYFLYYKPYFDKVWTLNPNSHCRSCEWSRSKHEPACKALDTISNYSKYFLQ